MVAIRPPIRHRYTSPVLRARLRSLARLGRRSGESGSLDSGVAALVDRSSAWGPEPSFATPISQPCTQAQLEDPRYHEWRHRLAEETVYNRKVWEWAWICEMLEREAARHDGAMQLVGFGVGTEPIVGWLAREGHSVLATDLPHDATETQRWATTNQHAADIDALDPRHIAAPEVLRDRVRFRPVDMRSLPPDLGEFDAMWSSCAIEHLGSLEAGFRFVDASLEHCRPGGLALHTTELNVSDERRTVESGHTVVYRKSDLEDFFGDLEARGHRVERTFHLGGHELDKRVDWPPFSNHHLKMPVEGVVTTSYGIAIRVGSE